MQNQKNHFQLDESITYLNGAYMSPMLRSVESMGRKGLEAKRNPFNIAPKDFFTDVEILQKEYAKLIGVKESKRVVIMPSVSYGIATAANNISLQKDEKILIVGEQFPSNYYTWEKVARKQGAKIVIVESPSTLENRGKIWNERILEAIDSKTKVVTLGNIHWADGTKFDLVAIRKRTREVGALLVIDGTQSVGVMPFNITEIQPDALICSGYKWLLGPYSMALGYFGEAFDGGDPIEESWMNRFESENFANLVSYQSNYQPFAQRYQVGEASNFVSVPMMTEAVRTLNNWGSDNIQNYCCEITKNATEILQNKGFWVEDLAFRSSHLFGIRLPERLKMESIKSKLAEAKIIVSIRGNAIRISPNVYNDKSDLEKLVEVLS
jgi:selenocysteine lyase/cysteine desulfurase